MIFVYPSKHAALNILLYLHLHPHLHSVAAFVYWLHKKIFVSSFLTCSFDMYIHTEWYPMRVSVVRLVTSLRSV